MTAFRVPVVVVLTPQPAGFPAIVAMRIYILIYTHVCVDTHTCVCRQALLWQAEKHVNFCSQKKRGDAGNRLSQSNAKRRNCWCI